MLAPLSWLRDFAPFPDDTTLLCDSLNSIGLVVESVQVAGAGLEDVVVAEVLQLDEIPGADNIRKVLVSDGDSHLEIVCGAKNFSVGDKVPLAKIGAQLPNGVTIGTRKMKGVTSYGMLCSGSELAIKDDADGLLILSPDCSPGEQLVKALGIIPDVIFELEVETNRPDALCISGVARDLAAKLKLPFSIPAPPQLKFSDSKLGIKVDISKSRICTRFTATPFGGIKVGPSDLTVSSRLRAVGMRPINNVVDASNYVMLELGQPTHAYDLDKLKDQTLRVRESKPGESIETLDGTTRSIPDSGEHCLICDVDDQPIGIGGLMGGASTEISAHTTRIVLEAAHFDHLSISHTARAFGLRSEASNRFERGVDPNGMYIAVRRFAQLLGGVEALAETIDIKTGSEKPRNTVLRVSRVNALLGTKITQAEIASIVNPLGYLTEIIDQDRMSVSIPTYRTDSTEEIDLVEEIARHYGYENIQPTVRMSPFVGHYSRRQLDRYKVKDTLSGAGLREVITSALVAPGEHEHSESGVDLGLVKLINPLAAEESVLRASLLPTLLGTAKYNLAYRNSDFKMFELGNVFSQPQNGIGSYASNLVDEQENLAAIVHSADQANNSRVAITQVVEYLAAVMECLSINDWTLSASEELTGLHMTRSAMVISGGERIGSIGEISPELYSEWGISGRLAFFELNFGALIVAIRSNENIEVPSKYPSSDIDLAFIVPQPAPVSSLRQVVIESVGKNAESVKVLDVFRDSAKLGSEYKSVTLRIRFVNPERTLTDKEVGELRVACIGAAERELNAKLR